MAKFKNSEPNGSISIGVGGQSIQSDADGFIVVPDEIITPEVIDTLMAHGYLAVDDTPAAAPAPKAKGK
jgi:hypothetical protein